MKIINLCSSEERAYDILQNRRCTPFGMCVSYACYYEIAYYSWYMRIDKESLKVTGNLRDVEIYEEMEQYSAQVIASDKI